MRHGQGRCHGSITPKEAVKRQTTRQRETERVVTERGGRDGRGSEESYSGISALVDPCTEFPKPAGSI